MRFEFRYLAVLTLFAGISLSAAVVPAADSGAPIAKPSNAKICLNCHKAEPNVIRGYFESAAGNAKTIQVKIDDVTELIMFDEDEIKVVNSEGKIGDGEFLKDNKVKKGHEIKIEYSENNGVRTANKLVEKPPVKVPAEMLMTTADIEKLVALGPEKGKYFLFDSRPQPRFQEGSIPTAVNLPFPAFDKMAEKLLPKDKKALIIFYCAGPACNMSPGSAEKAAKLGYTNLKVYKDGMPAWSTKNYGVLSVQSLKEAWIDKDIPHVLLDVRPLQDSGKGFIKGAVTFPAIDAAKLISDLPPKAKKPPVIVYDGKNGQQAVVVAKELLKAGYGKVMVLSGGFDAWQTAGFEAAKGTLAARATYTPKPRPGELNIDVFKKYVGELPANVMIIDVRTANEAKSGMFKNAKLIPAEEIKEHVGEIPKDKLIVTLCSTGVRGEMAYHALKALGYTNIAFVNAKIDFDKNGTYTISQN
jgi:rhodanese-related sulfurtransferase